MFSLLIKAGWVAWPLGLFSIVALGIVLERLFTLERLRAAEEIAFTQIESALSRGAEAPLTDPTLAGAPVTHVIATLNSLRGASEEAKQQAAEIAVAIQRLRLRRFLGTLATIGSISPFVGLFGTVLGVMRSFEAMSKTSLSGETMATGISEALSATALGLLVAIPSVMAYNFFTGRVQGLVLQIHGHVSRLIPLMGPKETRVRQEV